MPHSYRVSGVAHAPPETVWSLVATTSRWPEWSGVPRAVVERQGDPPPDGVGSIRRLGAGRFVSSREETLVWDPPHHMAYTILSGLPVRGYRADVELSPGPGPGTTLVVWRGSFDAKWAGTGALVAAALRQVIGLFTRRLCAHAGRMARATGPADQT